MNAEGNDNKTALDLAKTDEIRTYLAQAIKQKLKDKLQNNFIDFAKQCDIEEIRECVVA